MSSAGPDSSPKEDAKKASASRCKICDNLRTQTFGGEVALHFAGLDGLRKPIVWVFPKVLVCLDCGFAEFAVPDEQVKKLRDPDSSDHARRSVAV